MIEKYTNFSEVGSTGLDVNGGYINEEFLCELSGSKGLAIYKEMSSNDPVIGAILTVIEMLIRNVKSSVEAASEETDDIKVAEFVESCFEDMDEPFSEVIIEILSMLVYGFSVHELVYKRRNGKNKDEKKTSNYKDGKIGWARLPIRAQSTIVELGGWVLDDNGDLIAVEQVAPPKYRKVTIPNEKLLLFRPKKHKNNPEGLSVLRNAYRPWYYKKNIENIEGIGIERDLAGLPVIYCPSEVLKTTADSSLTSLRNNLQKIVTSIKRDEQEGILMPMIYDAKGNQMIKLELLNTGGTRQFDTNKITMRYDQRIAMTVLADFILLGHEAVGSFALADSKTHMFSTALGAWLKSIADVFNRKAIPRLLGLNGIEVEKMPSLVFDDIETVNLKELGELISSLSGAGMPLFPDEKLEAYVRRQANFPKVD